MATKPKPKDLRRLMKEQQNKSKKKIDSPLARYNNAGQLFCVLCNTLLKSDLLWDAHIRGTKHKENLVALKSGPPKPQPSATKHHPVQQDKLPNTCEVHVDRKFQAEPPSLNKRKNEENPVLPTVTPAPKRLKAASTAPVNPSIPPDFFDKDSSSSVDDQQMLVDNDTETSTRVPSTAVSDEAALPADFFDNSNSEKEEPENPSPSTDKQDAISESIPEGFFDDPKLDAKARKIEYKDPAEEEWEKFQKALSTENQVSEAIIYEEEEESRVDRALDEISEQRLYFIRADTLRDKQSAFKKSREEKRNETKTVDMTEESDSSSDDMEELFNWRAKKAL